MYTFFFSIFRALFTGAWENYDYQTATRIQKEFWSYFTHWLMNTLGGDFQTIQAFTWPESVPPSMFVPAIMATIAFVLVGCAVFGIVKKIFSIFFSGVR